MRNDGSNSQASGRIVLAATILGSSMAFIDGTVVNVALPALQNAFHASIADVQWVVESYALMLAALLLVGGSLGDLFGRRKMYVFGVAVFAAASAWCGLAQNIDMLIWARSIQGMGAALLVPGSLALITASFPEETRGQAIGTWSGFSAITAAIGPVIGGWLIEHSTWRWVFFLNLPLALAVILLSAKVPESRNEKASHHLDWPGALLATLGLGGVTYALIEWPSRARHGGSFRDGRSGFGCRCSGWIRCRGALVSRADGFAQAVSLAKLCRRESADLVPVCSAWWIDVLLSDGPDSDPTLHGH